MGREIALYAADPNPYQHPIWSQALPGVISEFRVRNNHWISLGMPPHQNNSKMISLICAIKVHNKLATKGQW